MANGSAVTHRIIAIDTGEDGGLVFTIKGDANNAADSLPVSEEQLARDRPPARIRQQTEQLGLFHRI